MESLGSVSHYVRIFVVSIFLVSVLYGCASPKLTTETIPLSGDTSAKKDIFVFLDGTGNNPGTETNVWKLYQLVAASDEQQTTALYIAGVGSAEDAPLSELALGRGMESRILEAYTFISENYAIGDRIFLFGFSRGAHQARSVAGLISYAGLLEQKGLERPDRIANANRVIELVKKQRDQDFQTHWQSWRMGQPPPLANLIGEKLGFATMPGDIAFLGVWDTVPGSSLKGYGVCKEEIGSIKKIGILIPGVNRGERYKSDSYPPIRHIAHAVSLDEKRSKFRPLLICPPIQTSTRVNEIWFPGAHADVGGGYEDSDDLSQISLKWMTNLLRNYYPLEAASITAGDPLGLAHWSIGDRPANIGSECEDRTPDANAQIDASVAARKRASAVPVRIKGVNVSVPYPISCASSEQAFHDAGVVQ